MSCPWANVKKLDGVSFAEIMSEQVAKDLQDKENKKHYQEVNTTKSDEASTSTQPDIIPEEFREAKEYLDSLENDALIARALQKEFDKEFDDDLMKRQQKLNGTSKLSLSFENFKRSSRGGDIESEEEEEGEVEDIQDRKDWDRFDTLYRDMASIPGCGYKIQPNGEVITKHDLVNSGRKNACKLLSFPPEFQTGDGEDFDLKLSNKVFNSLKIHSTKEQNRRLRSHDKKQDTATQEFGFDYQTRLGLYKMLESRFFEEINGIISIGKEAVVVHAVVNPNYESENVTYTLPPECAIKVFKSTLSEYKQRDRYIKDDHRFKDRVGNQHSKKVVHIWAEKEMANLMRVKRAGVKCPEVMTLKRHILVMSFIGKDRVAAPKLKDANLDFVNLTMAYEQVVSAMNALYHKAKLVHADLSEYNILWFDDSCYIIDVSQAVEPSHENAFQFLYRDCTNIINFFGKKGLDNILTADELFRSIVGHDFSDSKGLLALQDSFKLKPHLVGRPDVESTFNFENAWEKSDVLTVPPPKA